MPHVDHVPIELRRSVEHETLIVRDLIRKLRLLIEAGHIDHPPLGLLSQLGEHSHRLACAVRQFTIRTDFIRPDGEVVYSSYQEPIEFVEDQVRGNTDLILTAVPHDDEIYRSLGFSERELEDLNHLKELMAKEKPPNLQAAFDEFAGRIVRDLQKAKYDVTVEDVAFGVAGIVGIATDIVGFATSADIPQLVGSCGTGLAAIAAKFPAVRGKLLGRGR